MYKIVDGVQTFPDSFTFYYKSVVTGYKMIGNAVPVRMGKVLAEKIYNDLRNLKINRKHNILKSNQFFNGYVVREKMLEIVNAIAQ